MRHANRFAFKRDHLPNAAEYYREQGLKLYRRRRVGGRASQGGFFMLCSITRIGRARNYIAVAAIVTAAAIGILGKIWSLYG